MKEQVIYCNNAMLNLPGFNSTAAMSIKLTLGNAISFSDEAKDMHPSLSGSLCISDCNRVIELDCYASDKKDYENVMHKLKTLATIIGEALANLEDRQSQFNYKYDKAEVRVAKEKAEKELTKLNE